MADPLIDVLGRLLGEQRHGHLRPPYLIAVVVYQHVKELVTVLAHFFIFGLFAGLVETRHVAWQEKLRFGHEHRVILHDLHVPLQIGADCPGEERLS